ncbi:variant erythrocyte surface antigen-1 family protein, partial [Babesia divergens]
MGVLFFGSQCKTDGTFSSGCTSCENSDKYLCAGSNSHSTCPSHSSGSCKSQCPHPLQRFLVDSDSQSSDSLFQPPPGYPRMGFSKDNLSSTAKSGLTLYGVITVFCKSGFYPLSRLVQFGYCVSRRPPETLLELFAFFLRFGEVLNSDDFSENFARWIQDEPGRFLGKALKDAVQGLYGSSHRNGNGGHIEPSKTPASLRSIYDCAGGSKATCGKYLYPLIGDSYKLHPKAFLGAYVSWVCHRAEDFKTLLKEFKKDFEKCPHCKGSCPKIVTCPCSQPKLYKYGFAFKSPDDLNCRNHGNGSGTHNGGPDACTLKTCSQFITQLGLVLKDHSPLQNLLKAIDAFLWSIRLPFIYAFLY